MSDYPGIQYTPLSPSSKQVRTLTLRCGSARDPIKCYLHVVSLDNHPVYEALSYTWGDPGATKCIEVGGAQVDVTLNLEAALRHLREVDNDLVLWVDAICINQDDIDEKSEQVALMGQIYKQCSQVRVWLGCDAAQCCLEVQIHRVDSAMDKPLQRKDPFQLIRYLASGSHFYEWPCFGNAERKGGLDCEEAKAVEELGKGFLTIVNSTWWSRMWTVQEVILPKKGKLTYDTWSVTLEQITNCGTNYYDHVWDCCSEVMWRFTDSIQAFVDEFCTVFFTLAGDRTTLLEEGYFDIQDQHLSYGYRECQNPRDKVYGLLALVGDIDDLQLWLAPDYSHTEAEVFYDATCAMLYRDPRDLKCLTGAEYGAAEHKWASWVRNFGTLMTRLHANVGSNRLMIYDLFNASKGRRPRSTSYTTCPRLPDEIPYQVGLQVSGGCIGTIEPIFAEMKGGESPEEISQQRNTFKAWMQAADITPEDYQDAENYPPTVQNFWRTLLSGISSNGSATTTYSDWRRFEQKDLSWLSAFTAWLEDQAEHRPIALARTMLIATHGRCYFRTKSAGQGLCYPNGRAGDEVWIVNGSKVPFVLRRVGLSEEDGRALRPSQAYDFDNDGVYGPIKAWGEGEKISGFYELVGDCYFDGWMDGEGVGSERACRDAIILL